MNGPKPCCGDSIIYVGGGKFSTYDETFTLNGTCHNCGVEMTVEVTGWTVMDIEKAERGKPTDDNETDLKSYLRRYEEYERKCDDIKFTCKPTDDKEG